MKKILSFFIFLSFFLTPLHSFAEWGTLKSFQFWKVLPDTSIQSFKDSVIQKRSYSLTFWDSFWNITWKSFELSLDWRAFSDRKIIVRTFEFWMTCNEWEENKCRFSEDLMWLVMPQDPVVDFVADTSSYLIDKPISVNWTIIDKNWNPITNFNTSLWIDGNWLSE